MGLPTLSFDFWHISREKQEAHLLADFNSESTNGPVLDHTVGPF